MMQQPVIRLTKAQIMLFGSLILCTGFVALLYLTESFFVALEPLSKPALIRSMRNKGIDAYPAITPQIILMRNHLQPLTTLKGPRVLPLGGIAHKTTVFCQEADDMITYNSDRYGFRNEDSLWDKIIDVVAVGDSFVQGACMNEDDHLVSALRSTWPKTLNLGSFGNGPLANLATASEYALEKKPKYILWFYVANDLAIDLPLEERSVILASYLKNPRFSQNLRATQESIDQTLTGFLLEEIGRLENEAMPQTGFMGFLALEKLQNQLRRWQDKVLAPSAPDFPEAFDYDRQNSIDYNRHSHIVAEAADRAKAVGSELIFVLIPDARMYRPVANPDAQPRMHVEKMIASVESIGVQTINLYEIFASEKNPMKFFAGLGGYYGHFNRAGYKKAGNALVSELTAIDKQLTTSAANTAQSSLRK
jgi:hypothetical protein